MRKLHVFLIAAAATLATPIASAQSTTATDDDLDGVEMDVMDADGTPNDASTKVLALPDSASDTARAHAQKGLDTANTARQDGAAFGEATSEAARDGHGKPENPGPPEPPEAP
jgi:hypothetical protein